MGDWVSIRHIENGDSLILSTLPRRTVFTRRAAGSMPVDQAVAKFTRNRNKEVW